jgi:tartrate dehydratase beta subunit/fumarate hydratase class I family protein
MTLVKDIRKNITDTTPVYAAVGATDLAVERLREARARAGAVRLDRDVRVIQDRAVKRFEKTAEQVQQIPAQVRDQTVQAAGKARETYSDLAVRGEKLVKRIRNQKSTKDLFAQAGNTVSLGKGAVTTVRNAALDTQRAARVTLATGRREAGSVAVSVQEDVKATGRRAGKAASTTHNTAEGTVATAKKSAASSERAARSVAASARKTATSAAKTATSAAKTATPKVDR